jgi:hypothetical protein
MSIWPGIGLLSTVLAASVGQLLFKMAAERANAAQSFFAWDVLSVLCAALTLCVGATLIWIWVCAFDDCICVHVFIIRNRSSHGLPVSSRTLYLAARSRILSRRLRNLGFNQW